MASSKQIKALNAELDRLEKKYKSLNRISPFKGKDAEKMAKEYGSVRAAVEAVETSMKGINAEILEMESGLDGLKSIFADIGKELGDFDNPLKAATKSFKKIRGFAEDLSDIQYDLTKSTVKETKSLQAKVNLEFNRLKRQKQSLQNQLKSAKLTDEERDKIIELIALSTDKEKSLEEQVGYQSSFNDALAETIRRQKNINKAIGLSGKAVSGLAGFAEKIGFGDMSEDLNRISDQMKDHGAALTDNGDKAATLGDQFKVMGTGLKGLGASLMDALSDPLVIVGLIVKAVKFLADIFDHVLKTTNKIGQSLGIAGANAQALKDEIHAAGDAGGDMYYFTDEMVDNYIALNKAAGMNLKFNEKNAKTFQDMTHYMGVSEEQAAGLFKISAETGVPFSQIYDTTVDTVNALDKASNFSSDMGSIMEAMTTASSSVRYNIKGGAEGLVKAAHTANRLGLSMDEIAAAAESHLDFESSIAKEIEAEMYLQKDLNLDKLRYAALTGDTATAAAEEERLIKENMKSLKGNVLAQEAFAAATGISRDRLNDVMANQEKISKLTPQQLKDEKAKAAAMTEQGQEAQAFDRSMKSAMLQLKAALTPIAKTIGPYIIKAAEFLGNFIGSPAGKIVLGLAAGFMAVKGAMSLVKGVKNMFTGGMFEKGSYANPMIVQDISGGGSGMDMASNVLGKLGKRGVFGGKFFKGMSKVFGGKNTMLGRQLRNLSAMNLKRSSMLNQIVKNNSTLSKVFPKLSTLNSKLPQDIAQNIGKTLKVDKAGNVIKMANTAKTATTASNATKATSFFGKAKDLIPKGVTSTLSKAGPLLTKTLKVLGPVGVALDAGIGGFTGYSQAQMSAEEQKAAGVKENISTGEAIAQGILTGGAEKGSSLSKYVGIEKGGGADEAMGVLGSAGRGAAIGASIGSIIPGVGTAIGAGVGAVVGGAAEIGKLFTNPDSSLRKGLASMGESISDFASSAGEKISGWASSAGKGIASFAKGAWNTVSDLAGGAKDMAKSAYNYVKDSKVGRAVSSVGSAISSGVSAIGSFLGFAHGGIAPGGFKAFASGGVVSKPTLGLVGEGKMNEAIIPLPDGKSVPVKMAGGGSSGDSSQVAALLKELIAEVRKGGDVYLDGSKVGHSLALQSSKMG